MKNMVPLILAVLLGLAAAAAVGRLLRERQVAQERETSVVAAATAISQGDVLSSSSIMPKRVPLSARPEQAIPWSRAGMVTGQRARRSVVQGDYVMLSDVAFARSMAEIVGEGEWATTLRLGGGGIAALVQPGDEVAIIGTFRIQTAVKSADLSEAAEAVDKEATMTLFPRVRVLDVGGMGDVRRGDSPGTEIVVALPPRQAQMLIAAQRKASLTVALRRPGDESAISRQDVGMVDEESFDRLLQGLESVQVPFVPGTVTEGQ